MDKSDLPIIVESDTSNLLKHQGESSAPPQPKSGSLKRGIQLVIVIFGLIVLGEIIYGIKTLSTPSPTSGKVQPMTGGRVSLVSATEAYKVGDAVPIKVRINTGGHLINGADVIIKYNSKLLLANDSSVVPVGIFSEFPLVKVDNGEGTIRISGIVGVGQPGYVGIDTLANIELVAIGAGKTEITLESTAGSTTDTNLIEVDKAQDIIESVQNLSIEIVN